MAGSKHDIVSFKVDHELMELLRQVPNRSEFIRSAILVALDSACPLCNGTGILETQRRRIWERLAQTHPQAECQRCHERIFTCDGKPMDHDCTLPQRRAR